jgi:membrane peptidoglycan carboxypeptidase
VAAASRKTLTTTVKLVIAAVVGGVVLAAVALPTVGGIGLVAKAGSNTFRNLPTQLKDDGNPPERSEILAADGQRLANLYLQNRRVVPLSQIAPVARKALIAIEDSRFYEHKALDYRGIIRALVTNGRAGSVQQGGSTLTQQYVKQVLLYQATTPAEQRAAIADNVGRKLKEARLAVALERKLTKDQILTRYLNIAYFGEGAYGIETAAHTYFGVSAKELSLPQAAMLAGLVQSPSGDDPFHDKGRASARRHEVLARMHQLGVISSAQFSTADGTPITLVKKVVEPANGCGQTLLPNTGFFCDYVRSYLTDVLHLTHAQLYKGGLTIKTTLDPNIQAHAMASVAANDPMGNPAAAVMDVVRPGTGAVQAMAVNRTYGSDPNDKSQTTINLGVRAVAQAGSTYKVFTLAAALQRQVPIFFRINSPQHFTSTVFHGYPVHNDGADEACDCTLGRATVQSVNTYFVKLLESRYFNGDLTDPIRDAQRMGLAPRSLPNSLADQMIKEQQASFTLGSPATSPLDMASAAATIAAKGKYCPPNPIVSITGPDGHAVKVPRTPCSQVLKPKIAVGMTSILRGDPSNQEPWVSYNTASNAALDYQHPAAGKTGTSNDNAALWFIGYTPNLASSVAVFNPDSPSKEVTTIPGNPGPLYGKFAAQIWHDAVQPIVANEPAWTWPAPM